VRFVSFAEQPELRERRRELRDTFLEFMHHDAVCNRYWGSLFDEHPDYQFGLLDGEILVAEGNCVPTRWEGPDPRGVGAVLESTFARREQANIVSALQIRIAPEYQGRGLSSTLVDHMRGVTRAHGFGALVAPVRPNRKPQYPLIPMERYVSWTRADGLPFDPWMRVHARLGAEIVAVCAESMTIEGTVAEWEEWAQMPFPDSGSYVVPDALVPVEIDRERDIGRYVEPNVWMRHAV
jgi:GNAT superfamily N-acetyltransferase